MRNSSSRFRRWVVRVVGVPLAGWLQGAGKDIRRTIDEIQVFTEKHDINADRAARGACTKFDAWTQVENSSNQRNLAEAAERANQAEAINISNERLLKNEVNLDRIDAAKASQEEATARAYELANEQKRVEVARAKAELFLFLRENNLALTRAEDGSTDVVKIPCAIDYPALDQPQTISGAASQDDSSNEDELKP